MEFYKEILAHALTRGEVQITFPNEKPDIPKILEGECYIALQKIKAIIEDDSLIDEACFWRIKEIVRVLEELGSNGGNRHDFG